MYNDVMRGQIIMQICLYTISSTALVLVEKIDAAGNFIFDAYKSEQSGTFHT